MREREAELKKCRWSTLRKIRIALAATKYARKNPLASPEVCIKAVWDDILIRPEQKQLETHPYQSHIAWVIRWIQKRR
jgi:hypothetical protein